MSTSRRRFLKFGMVAAVVAAVPMKSVLGQDWKERDGNPGEVGISGDALSQFSKATFQAYLNSVFELHTGSAIVAVTLTEVKDLQSSRGGEAFSLLFRGGARPLRQNSYVLVHPALGSFSLLLVPSGADRNGAQGFVATINRLSFVEALQNPAPAKSRSRTEPEKPNASSTPSSEAPAASAPEQNSSPAPASTTDQPRKRKPSWKELDNDFHELLN